MLKRVFSVILAVVAALLLAVFVTSWVRNVQARRVTVPPEATAFVAIHTDELMRQMILQGARSPGGPVEKPWRSLGLRLPARIYLYRLGTSWYTRFRCADTLRFDKEIARQVVAAGDGSFPVNVPLRWHRSGSEVVLILFPAANADQVAASLRERKDLRPIPSGLLAQLDGAPLAYADPDNIIKFQVQRGAVTARAVFKNQKNLRTSGSRHRPFAAQAGLRFWIEAGGLGPAIPDSLKIGQGVLSMQHLKQVPPAYIDAEWTGTVAQTERVVTYTFDDNFEKVEQVEQREHQVPGFFVTATAGRARNNSTMVWLKTDGLVPLDSAVNREVFPLYRLHLRSDSLSAGVGTAPALFAAGRTVRSKAFAGLDVNFRQLHGIPANLKTRLAPFAALRMRAFQQGSSIRVHARLQLTDKDLHPLLLFR